MSAPRFEVVGLPGFPEVRPGDDLVALLIEALDGEPLLDGDVLAVASKIVSKAEGRVLSGIDRDAAIDAEAVRTVAEWTTPRGRTRVVETRHGFVMAAAGVDASNVERGNVVLLPVDPDASARRIRDSVRDRLGVAVGIIITDTAGRVWRNGVVDFAAGSAGVMALDDLRGRSDCHGNDLGVTVVAVADEIAAASELVRTKLAGMPVAVVRGLSHVVLDTDAADTGTAALIRPSTEDRFRLGTPEAMRAAVVSRRTARRFTSDPVDGAVVRRALAAALTAPFPGDIPPWRFALVESHEARAAIAAVAEPDDIETLRSAATIVVPCSVDHGRTAVAGLGAAVENLLVALGAEGIGSAWVFPASPLPPSLDLPAEWAPVGMVAVGHAVDPGPDHPPHDVATVTVTR